MDERFDILKKYNLWRNHDFDLGYIRNAYTDKIVAYTSNRLVKVLVGQRRVGKSYLLRQVAQRMISEGVRAENTLLINRELADFDFLATYQDLISLVQLYMREVKPQGTVYLFIDEVQLIAGWERAVNSWSQDYAEPYEVFISGSNSTLLSGELATLLSGRHISFEVLPFSFLEHAGIRQIPPDRVAYIDYMRSGGLPELYALPAPEMQCNYTEAVKNTVLLRDIIQRHNVRDPKLLESIFIFLVNNASNLISISGLAKYFKSQGRKTSYEIVANYIGYIEDTFLVHRCERFDIRGRNTIAGNAKYYLNDLAFHNYLFSGFGYGYGYLLENLVYIELRRAGFSIYTGVAGGKEIDFVAQKADRTIYLQCAYMLTDGATAEREYSALESVADNFEKVVVTLDEISFPLRGGIRHLQAWRLAEIL